MANFFGKFPLIGYNINRTLNSPSEYQLATDIMVRVRVLSERLNQIFHYYEYFVKDGETPEILAEKFYGDPEAHWLILMTNNMTDPLFDWPLETSVFNKYIIAKYGSIAIAQTTYHHFEKVFQTYDVTSRTTTYDRIQIVQNPVSNLTVVNAGRGYAANGYMAISTNYGVGANISYTINAAGSIVSATIGLGGSYVGAPNISISGANTSTANILSFVATSNLWSSLPADIGGYSSNSIGGYVVNAYLPYRNSVTNYDWEFQKNEDRRRIKLIKKEYYGRILQEFSNIMTAANPNKVVSGIRTL